MEILNCSWEKGVIPERRKEAILISVLKKDKAPTNPNSYRHVSLLSCTGKLFETGMAS